MPFAHRRTIVGTAAFAAALIASAPTRSQPAESVRLDPALGATVRELVTEFYATRPEQRAWSRGAARDTGHDLLLAVEQADQHGLCAAPTSALRDWLDSGQETTGSTARFNDVRVTEALASHLAQLALGRHTIAAGETLSTRALEVSALLEQAAMGRPARDILDVAQPRHREYAQLRQALTVYRRMRASGIGRKSRAACDSTQIETRSPRW
jgi:hypothetical protein